MNTLRSTCSFGIILLLLSQFFLSKVNGASVQLNGAIVEDGSIWNFALSPNGNRLIYLAEQDILGVQELYDVSAFGGPVNKLHTDFNAGDFVWDFKISPDSTRVAFSAQRNGLNRDVLYSTGFGNNFEDQLDAPTAVGHSFINDFHAGQNGQHVVYRADHSVLGKPELYSSLDFGLPVKLNGTLVSGGVVEFFNESYLSPNGSRALYVADQAINDVFELYSVPSIGGAATKLNGTLVSGGDVGGAAVQFSPNGSTVLYVADQAVNDVFELYRVPATGGTPVKVNGTLVAGGTVRDDIDNVKFSPDGSRILYVASQATADVFELYSAPAAGGTPVKLNGTMASGGDIGTDAVMVSPNGARVVYVADQTTDGKNELYSVPITGGTAVKLNGPLVAGGNVEDEREDVQITPNSSHVIYLADQNTDGISELYSVPLTGGTAVKLNGPLAPGGEVEDESIRITPDSRRVLYTADQETSGKDELYIVLASGGTPKKINGLFAGSVDDNFVISPDGSRVYYRAATTESGVFDGLFYHALKTQWSGGSGSWNDRNKWNQKAVPDLVTEVQITGPATVLAVGEVGVPVTDYGADILQIGGGAGNSVLQLDNQSALTVTYGTTIASGGVIRGDGYVYSEVVNTPGGEVRVADGQRLHFDGGLFDNDGSVQVVGTPTSPAEIEFSGGVNNSASTGQIAGRHAALHFSGGLINNGALVLSAGESDVFGDIDNTGTIVVSGGATVTFYDDIIQDGTLTISKVGSTTSAAVFLGDVAGAGTTGGGGDIFLEGDLRPGNSPGTLSFQNNVFLGAETSVDIELGGDTPGAEYDTIEVDGQLSLDGKLNASLIMNEGEWFFPDSQDPFVIISATQGITGTFDDENLPDPQGGLFWDIEYGDNSVTLVVEGQVGDYNYDGKVSAADFTVWRDTFGSTADDALAADGNGDKIVDQDDLQVWKDQFGEGTFGSGAGNAVNSASIPEPTNFALSGLAAMVLVPWLARCRST